MVTNGKIEPGYKPFPNPDTILKKEENGQFLLVNLDTGKAVSLNAMGMFIWKTADGNITVAEIIDKIRQSFSSVPEDISKDVTGTINILKLNGFFGVEVKSDPL